MWLFDSTAAAAAAAVYHCLVQVVMDAVQSRQRARGLSDLLSDFDGQLRTDAHCLPPVVTLATPPTCQERLERNAIPMCRLTESCWQELRHGETGYYGPYLQTRGPDLPN